MKKKKNRVLLIAQISELHYYSSALVLALGSQRVGVCYASATPVGGGVRGAALRGVAGGVGGARSCGP